MEEKSNSGHSDTLATQLRVPLSEIEAQSVIEYRRRLYLALWEKSTQEGLIEIFSRPTTQEEAESRFNVDASGRDIFTALLKLLCRAGALRTYFDPTGKRVYVDTESALPVPSEAGATELLSPQDAVLSVHDATGQLALHQASHIPDMTFAALKHSEVRVQFSRPFEKWWRAALEAKFYASGRGMSSQEIGGPGFTVLDLASGLGHGLQSLVEVVGPTGKVIGIEVSPHHLEVSQRLAEQYSNVTIYDADLNDGLPMISPESIDGVMITGAFHFILRKEFLINEIDRVTRHGAKVVIGNCFMDIDVFDREYLELLFSLIKPIARPIRPDVLKLLMGVHGFDIYFEYLVGAFGWYFFQKAFR